MKQSIRIGRLVRCGLACAAALTPLSAFADGLGQPFPEPAKEIAKRSDAGERAIERFKAPAGVKVSLFASEPDLVNPVAIATDEKGRWYVCETFRLHAGVTDIRGIMSWLDDDLACRTVEDRIAMHKRHQGAEKAEKELTAHTDRLRLLEDTDGDGKVDKATIFADGFNGMADGLASGVLARKGTVYFTNIPHLWALKDKDGDGRADEKKSLSYGYGIRVGFLGHDLHGLRFGPDGKLYFTVGDRGANVKTERGAVESFDTGCTFRCNPDGSELEIFATGQRNPQELVFDQYGNLFSGDNNCDHGDPARWEYIVEGGDYGWRVGYQHLPNAGPWNNEKIHALEKDTNCFYVTPPIAHIAAGPSGTTYHPGVAALPEKYKQHFFLVDFRGGATGSGIHSFVMKNKGASFELTDRENFLWNILATDVDFGVDGAMYVSDWVNGWAKPTMGRIYKLSSEMSQSAEIEETKKLIGEGMEKRGEEELAKLLAHPDMRVRQAAQFELADRGAKSTKVFEEVAAKKENQLARLHAIWGLGQIARKDAKVLSDVAALLNDGDAEVQTQAAKVLGEHHYPGANRQLVEILKGNSARAKFYAAMALGKAADRQTSAALLQMLRDNSDKDAYLRHAGVMGLVWANDREALLRAAGDESASVRMGVLLAMRRLGMPQAAKFLHDSDERVVLEAARAINDAPINEAMGELAKLIDQPNLNRFVLQRVLNANYRLGTPEAAGALAKFATRGDVPSAVRVEALEMLESWANPSGRDKVVGVWRPLAPRDGKVADAAARGVVGDLVRQAKTPESVRVAALKVMERVGSSDANLIYAIAMDKSAPPEVRAGALRAMDKQNDPKLAEALKVGLTGTGPLRREAIRLQMKFPDAVQRLDQILSEGSTSDQQAVFAALSLAGGDAVDELLGRWMDRLLAGKVAKEVALDVLEAASKNRGAAVEEKVNEYNAKRDPKDDLRDFRESLYGGDAASGRKIFYERQDVSCIRCHKIDSEGGIVAPDLTGIGKRQPREYFLESILLPNKQVAPGFESVVVKAKLPSGKTKTYNGVLKAETGDELTIEVPDQPLAKVKRTDVISRERGPSAMPENISQTLSKRDLRDLVEFLASLR